MKIAYNPLGSGAHTPAPDNKDIIFDLVTRTIYAKGVPFDGTKYIAFKKHTSPDNTGGSEGLVPIPSYSTTNTRLLREDGQWVNVAGVSAPDDYLSTESTNSVENRVIAEEFEKVFAQLILKAENVYKIINVGGINLVASGTNDVLEFVQGNGIQLLPSETNKSITISTRAIGQQGIDISYNSGQLIAKVADTYFNRWNQVFNWYTSVTEEDTDGVINKWQEIVDFVDSVAEGTDITDEFVTRKTNQTITGVKTFNTNGISTTIENGTVRHYISTDGGWARGFSVSNTSGNTTVIGSFGVYGEGVGTGDNRIEYLYASHQDQNYDNAVLKIYKDRIIVAGHEVYHKGNLKNLSDLNNDLYWADIPVSSTPSIVTSPTFAYPTSRYSQFTNGSETIGYIGRGNNTDNLYFGNYKNANISIFTDNNTSNCIYLKTGGNVGIGTTDPKYKLHVTGDIRGSSIYSLHTYINTGGEGIYLSGSGIYYHNASNQWRSDLITFDSSLINLRQNTACLGTLFVTGTGTFNSQIISNVADGTAPLTVISTTKVENLNADLLDGYHESKFFKYRGWVSANADLNTIVDNSIRSLNGDNGNYVNSPVNYGNLISFGDCDSDYKYGKVQFLTSSSTELYVRNHFNGWKDWKQIAFKEDIPIVTNYYWADVPVSNTSNSATSPTFKKIKVTENIELHGSIVGTNNASTIKGALLRSGSGRSDSSPDGDTWIYGDSLGAKPWGFMHEQGDNLISFYGNGIRTSFINLQSGYITSNGFIKSDSSNSYVLLGGGSHKLISDIIKEGYIGTTQVQTTSTAQSLTGIVDITMSGKINSVAKVTIKGSASAILNIEETQATVNYSHIYVSSSTSTYATTRPLVLQYGYGNVGVGIATPTVKLDVSGTVRASSNMIAPYFFAGVDKEGLYLTDNGIHWHDANYSYTNPILYLNPTTITIGPNIVYFKDSGTAAIKYGLHTATALGAYPLPSLGSNGIGIFVRPNKSIDEGGIIITEDTCMIFNSADVEWAFQVHNTDLSQKNFSGTSGAGEVSRVFGVQATNLVWSKGGYVKNGYDDNYALLAGGGTKQINNVQNTAFYKRVTTINGTGWDMAGTLNSAAFTIYAPTTAGTSGQLLQSSGGTPTWINPYFMEFGGDVAGTANTPFSYAQSYFTDSVGKGKMKGLYNHSGVEYALLFSKAASGSVGTVLAWTYNDTYLRIGRYYSSSWKTSDWEKISAGYADTCKSFIRVSANANPTDLNTVLSGGGIAYNYGSSAYWSNGPSGMSYGQVLQLCSSQSNTMAGQLAWDINHASTTDTTRYLWWRATDDGTWTEAKWHRIVFAESLDSYLALSGGTVSGKTIIVGQSTGAASITSDLDALVIGTKQQRTGTVNYYYPGIAFNHMWQWSGGTTYNASSHAWIGLKLHSTPTSELSYLVFATKSTTGTSDRPTEKMRIAPDGTITATGSIYAAHFYENSDIQLKANIQEILSSDKMPTIKEFDWKEDNSHSYGLIAQELEEQGYSELVSTKDDGYKTVNYSAALSLIVGKLQVKIKELEKEIENLKNKN